MLEYRLLTGEIMLNFVKKKFFKCPNDKELFLVSHVAMRKRMKTSRAGGRRQHRAFLTLLPGMSTGAFF